MDIAKKAALVTGASRGLGEALALGLGARGVRVVLTGRSRTSLQPIVERIRAGGGEAHALESDIADKHAIYPLVGAATALVGDIDLLLHNASELGPTPLRLLLDTECEDLERVLAVNLLGPFRLSKALAGSMALRRTGTIVHVSSDASVNAYERWGAYAVSKAALDHLARLWAAELDGHGVRSFSVDPGEMATRMHAAALPDADPSTLARPSDVAAKILNMIESRQIENGSRIEAGSWEIAS